MAVIGISTINTDVDYAFEAIVPAKRMSMAQWLRERFRMPNGKSFEERSVPWVTAPNGPCDAIDSPQYRVIWLQWAARMFKTNLGQALHMMRADTDPCTMMFATVDELLCKTIFNRLWDSLEECPTLRHECPSERFQSATHIRLRRSQIYGAWARGKSRLADKSIQVGHGNEIDKWDQVATSTEGDPLPRFLKRGAEYPDRKFLLEGTPAEKGRSRVEAGRLRSNNCRYWVPCPHCNRFQPLVFGDESVKHGLKWDRKEGGKSDPDVAMRTARYHCVNCLRAVEDIHRPEMVNLGVWVPEGCDVDDQIAMIARDLPQFSNRFLIGDPLRDSDEWGGQISVLYALFHGWGTPARDFIIKRKKPDELRQYINEDLAETFERKRQQKTWEQLADVMIRDTPRYTLPRHYRILTAAVDKQERDPPYPYTITCWAEGYKSHTIDYGYLDDLEEVSEVLRRTYYDTDGTKYGIQMVLFDSGFRPAEVADFCSKMRQKYRLRIRPCKGSSKNLDTLYKKSQQGPRSAMPGQILVLVDTWTSQDWIDNEISSMGSDGAATKTVYASPREDHQEFFEQLINDSPVEVVTKSSSVRLQWERIDDDIPNDYRDCLRYEYAAARMLTRGNKWPKAKTPPTRKTKPPATMPPPLQRPGGWATDWRNA